MRSTGEERGITFASAGSVCSDEGELAIDEDPAASNSVPNFIFVPDPNVVVREGEECLSKALEELAAIDGRAKAASEGDSFVDIMGSL